MAELALQLPVFIASPSDVVDERKVIAEEVRELAVTAGKHGLLLRPICWELDARPTMQRAQASINELLKTAELVVVVLWSTLGSESAPGAEDSGTLEELLRATEQVLHGASDDVLVYFRESPVPAEAAESYARVQAFRNKLELSRRVFFWRYNTPEELRGEFANHLRLWLERWQVVPDICVNTLAVSAPGTPMPEAYGENRLAQIRRFYRTEREPALTAELGLAATEMYQQFGPRAVQEPLRLSGAVAQTATKYVGSVEDISRVHLMRLIGRIEPSAAPLRTEDGEYYFADDEWFSFFCAAGLIDAIRADQVGAADREPYINPVHQYLAALALPLRDEIIAKLTGWLLNVSMITYARPVARNFAAFVLGMLSAEEAQDALIEAAETDPGTDVRLYSVVSLGRMRSRRHLARLVALWRRENDPRFRTVLGQVVCRIVGVGHYPF
jgi:hypothetical protein